VSGGALGEGLAAAPVDPVRLDRLARLSLGVGVDLAPGQDLLIVSPVSAAPLVRRIAAHAYRMGAGLVTPIYLDEEVTRLRFAEGEDFGFDRAPGWLYSAWADAYRAGTARLVVEAKDPLLLAGADPGRSARASRADALAMRPSLTLTTAFAVNWSKVPYPSPAWARAVFPDLPEGQAVERLAEALFAACRVNGRDPAADWAEHDARLHRRARWLTERGFAALRYAGPGTDFTVGLADGHRWKGGSSPTRNGRVSTANIPTEEVFTAPHRERAEGVLRATKPLCHNGTMIEGLEMRFSGGRVVEVRAKRGAEVFSRLIEADEGARRLGEVALVPHSSPISQSGLLFFLTLLDENASCHIAMGQCYADCFGGGPDLAPEAIAARGGNASAIHVDWMIGSADIDIDGINRDGTAEPVMRGGEWAR
jgi:aminopeptidase